MTNYTLQVIRLLPETILTAFGIIIMLAEPFVRRKRWLAYIGVAGLLCALFGALYQTGYTGLAFNNQVSNDTFSTFFRLLFILIGILIILASPEYLEQNNIRDGEYYALVLLSIVGQCLMACSVELVMIFIALEISSIATYVLAGFRTRAAKSSEASLKYFLLGSFATAFFLYGVALIFGVTGSTQLHTVHAELGKTAGVMPPLAAIGAGLMFVGLAFKVAAAPFHVWTPDVYEGSPTPVSAFMSAGPKAAAFAVFLRIFITALGPNTGWFWLLWVSALLSMYIGNLAALVQTNIKRMLAYSSIAHAGYILVAFTARSEIGIGAVLFYLAAYSIMNIGAFMVVSHLGGENEKLVNIEDYAGLAQRQPALAVLLSIFLLSLIGIPLTGGFFGKFYIFRAALHAHLVWLTILGVIASAIGAYYYLRIIVMMYMHDPVTDTPLPPLTGAIRFVLVLSAIITIYLGVLPSDVVSFATRAGAVLK